jgi:hypothetical protein
MAIYKSKELGNTGLYLSYWRIESLMWDVPHDIIHLQMAGWPNVDAYLAGKSSTIIPVIVEQVSSSPLNFPIQEASVGSPQGDLLLNQIQQGLVKLPDFQDGLIV